MKSEDGKGSSPDKFEPVVSGPPRELKTRDDLKRPNPYLNDWVQVATRAAKKTSR